MKTIFALFMLTAFILPGCGSAGEEQTAVDKCDNLVNVVCTRAAECAISSKGECLDGAQLYMPCGKANAVAASYPYCIDALEHMSCGTLFAGGELQLPADCYQVILE